MGIILDSKTTHTGGDIDEFYIETGPPGNKTRYLFWGSWWGIFGQQLADDMKTLIGDHFQIGAKYMEGTMLLEKDGWFYFFASSGSCCSGNISDYFIHMGKSKDIRGPYVTKEGKTMMDGSGSIFLHGEPSIGWIGPGHCGEMRQDDKGRWFLVYHAVARGNANLPLPWNFTRRPLMMDEVFWDKDGWPYIENDIPSTTWKRAPYYKNVHP
jgi:arabinan endo-1,5-alpha-L-arabinosidase